MIHKNHAEIAAEGVRTGIQSQKDLLDSTKINVAGGGGCPRLHAKRMHIELACREIRVVIEGFEGPQRDGVVRTGAHGLVTVEAQSDALETVSGIVVRRRAINLNQEEHLSNWILKVQDEHTRCEIRLKPERPILTLRYDLFYATLSEPVYFWLGQVYVLGDDGRVQDGVHDSGDGCKIVECVKIHMDLHILTLERHEGNRKLCSIEEIKW